MLVLSRMRDQRCVITTASGEQIEVTVVAVRGDKVRLGFVVDKSIAVHREEVQRLVDEEAAA